MNKKKEVKLNGKFASEGGMEEDIAARKKKEPAFASALETYEGEHVLGLELARLRKRRGLRQEDVALAMKTSAQAVGRMEKAEYRGHNFSTVFRYVEALGGSLEIKGTKQGFRIEVLAPSGGE